MDDVISDCNSKMKRTVDSFIKEISKIRGGALSKSLFDEIRVDYYGSEVPLNQVFYLLFAELVSQPFR